MSILDDINKTIGNVAQVSTDFMMGGPTAIDLRKQLNDLKERQAYLIAAYKSGQPQTVAWISPINDAVSMVTTMLQKTSEYVQGIAFNYNSVLQTGSMSIQAITDIEKAGLSSNKLLNLDIPSEFGGFPSALVPGVLAVEMVEGIVNAFDDIATLQEQVYEAQSNNQKIEEAIQDYERLGEILMILEDYLLDIATDAITLYQHSTGLQFDSLPLRADTASDLTSLNSRILDIVERLEHINGNAFMIFRTIIRLTESGKISQSGVTNVQLDYLSQKLYGLSTVSAVFGNQDTVRQFVANCFQGQLLSILPTFLNLPPIPDAVKSMVSQTPSQQSSFDLNSPKYDPPDDLNLSDIP